MDNRQTQAPPLQTRDVAKLLDVSSERVRQLARAGRLSPTRTQSGTRLYTRADVEQYIKSRQ